MNTTKLIVVSAYAALSALSAVSAHADEADGSQAPLKFSSARTVASVQAEARTPVKISNGGTGFIGVTESATSRAAVRTEGRMAARSGQTSRGEV